MAARARCIMGGTALYQAAQMVLAKGRAIAARLLQADAGRGRASPPGGSRSAAASAASTFWRWRSAAADPRICRTARCPGLDAYAWNECDVFTFPEGCHVAEVEIDPETGAVTLERYLAVDDYGRRDQSDADGGPGAGRASPRASARRCCEHTVYDEESGQLLSGSLMDYALPRADDLPPLDITLDGLPTAANPLGVKGAGQAGAHRRAADDHRAILDALAPLGVEHIDMPATPERVWRAIRNARRAP